jgi:hypothetical protein
VRHSFLPKFFCISPHARRGRKAQFRIPATPNARVIIKQCPSIEGAGNAGAPIAPAALRVKVVNTQVSHHGHAGSIRHSPRNGFNGLFHALPGDRAFCHRHQRDA